MLSTPLLFTAYTSGTVTTLDQVGECFMKFMVDLRQDFQKKGYLIQQVDHQVKADERKTMDAYDRKSYYYDYLITVSIIYSKD